jgi:hypothetical protein
MSAAEMPPDPFTAEPGDLIAEAQEIGSVLLTPWSTGSGPRGSSASAPSLRSTAQTWSGSWWRCSAKF